MDTLASFATPFSTTGHVATRPRRHTIDVRLFGARALPSHRLIAAVLGPRAHADDVASLAAALALSGAARDAALLQHPCGPRLLAALELGRRAALWPTMSTTRIDGPAYVVAAIAGRLIPEERRWLIAVDERGRVARAAATDGAEVQGQAATILQLTLSAGCRAFVLVSGVDVVSDADVVAAEAGVFAAVRAQASVVGVAAIDHVVVGEDGWVSLLRLGVIDAIDQRYR